MPDFSELAKYLSEQIDLGDSIVLLDEPWSPPKQPRPMISSTAAPINPPVKTAAYTPKPPSEPPKKIAPLQPKATQIVIPESAKSTTPSAYESAQTLDEFYHLVSTEKIYAKTPFAKGEANLASPFGCRANGLPNVWQFEHSSRRNRHHIFLQKTNRKNSTSAGRPGFEKNAGKRSIADSPENSRIFWRQTFKTGAFPKFGKDVRLWWHALGIRPNTGDGAY